MTQTQEKIIPQVSKSPEQDKWDQFKIAARRAWSKLTDEDFRKANGSIETLSGIIHHKFGETRFAIRTKLLANTAQQKASTDGAKAT